MTDLVNGHRQGPFVIFEDEDGLRHAVRLGAVLSLSEMAGEREATIVQFSGQRSAVVRRSFGQVLNWLT